MNRLCSTVCSRCRNDLFRPTAAGQKIFVRRRSTKGLTSRPTSTAKKAIPHGHDFGAPPFKKPRRPPSGPSLAPRQNVPSPTRESIQEFLGKDVTGWSKNPRTIGMLVNFGLEPADIKPMLAQFVIALEEYTVLSSLEYGEDYLQRMTNDFAASPHEKPLIHNRWLFRLFFEWATTPAGYAALKKVASPAALFIVSEIFHAADLSKPEALYPRTRSAPPRKVIMHVGPTNSGKTHNALRALAAARTGVYAGPLRLLAHEIWERLNKGQIIPAGVDVSKEEVEEDPEINLDIGPQPVIRKDVDKRYARQCNMITGEEQKIVDMNATLISCTVEMLPVGRRFDVAVIDEIQLLGDSDRGGAWLRALLGVNADEIHLCGEETAVPLVQSLLGGTGDEVVVNRYERLTPLRVEDESLNGDLSKVRKGDCLVAFSRKQVFAMRKRIEQLKGVQCAVAYGRLPPELRSEQAALFNDPNSGYDVLVGTDAIGMGLNLKIKRIILKSVRKFNGIRKVPLSTSQIKQIAGRAGRYGLHGDNAGGTATTLEEPDLPVLKKALAEPYKPLTEARLSLFNPSYQALSKVLPHHAGVLTIADAMFYVSKLHPMCELEDLTKIHKLFGFLAELQGDLTVADQTILQLAPAPGTDLAVQHALQVAARMYSTRLSVRLMDLLRQANLLDDYNHSMRVVAKKSGNYQAALDSLETVHKVIVMYLWLSYRLPVAFMEQEEAFKLRDRVEKVMQECLELISAVEGPKPKKPNVGGERIPFKTRAQVDAESAQRRLKGVEQARSPKYMQPNSAGQIDATS